MEKEREEGNGSDGEGTEAEEEAERVSALDEQEGVPERVGERMGSAGIR